MRPSAWWTRWCSARAATQVAHADAVQAARCVVLKALTYAPTGGIVAAPTTSLPECIGGVRNWDYRFCWLRDATFTLYALLLAGYRDEAKAWREWLLRAAAGRPQDLQMLYGVAGERIRGEIEIALAAGLPRLRAGAHRQRRRQRRCSSTSTARSSTRCASRARPGSTTTTTPGRSSARCSTTSRRTGPTPDSGIWEMRGEPQHFTHSKVMAWVAFDRAIHAVERHGLPGAGGALAEDARRDPSRRLRARLRSAARRVRAALRIATSSTRACC